ncbi:MAG: DrmE family protein [Clostridium butyricum]|nr:DrmE family protein [Clostridium butyricum]
MEYKKIITKDDIANYNENETFIFVSKYRRTNEFQYSYIRKNNVVNILNNVQANKYNSKARFTNKLLDIIESNNRLSSEDRKATKDEYMPIINLKEKILLEKVEVNDEENNDILETYVEKELHDFDYIKEIKKLTNIKLNKFNTSQESMYSGTVTVTRKIYYSEDGYSYITDNSKIVMLDDNNKIKGFINNAKISDRILFIDEKTENDLNILFDKIVESKIFKEKYKQHYQNMIYWKKVLRKYIDDYNLNYNDIANELIIHEISKTPQTIRGWLKSESIIGPWEEKFYKALGEITFDQKLISNWKEIFESNNTIREFRRQFRNTFKNMIQHAVCNTISEENELEILVNRVFGNLKEYAKILKIVDIDEISLEIPYAQTNCLIYDK